jgi:DNA-directed RNA polymerase sigma subunit (sigma70/sigma32)
LSSGQQRIIFKERAGSAMTSPWGDKEMAEREGVGDRTIRVPEHMIETINRLVRASRQMLTEIGREPNAEELAEKLAMPLDKVRKVLNIANQPITLAAPIGGAGDPDLG